MSADYWNSTQRLNWQFTREELKEKRRLLEQLENELVADGSILPLVKDIQYDYHMRIFLHGLTRRLGRRLNLRSIPQATAEVYLKRFLVTVSLKEINVYLLVTTCVYLACKVEECPQHIRSISNEARNLWPEYIPHDLTKIAEFEFYLIEEMENYMIVHNPYNSLTQIKDMLAKTNFGMLDKKNGINDLDNLNIYGNYSNFGSSSLYGGANTKKDKLVDGVNCLRFTADELQLSWSIINDSYVTDICLLFPPHIVAVAAVYFTIILKAGSMGLPKMTSTQSRKVVEELENLTDQDIDSNVKSRINVLTNFLGISNVDLDEVIESIQEIITLYEIWDSYDESAVKKKVQKLFINR